ncbi:MAG: HAD family hydrolase [Desulfovibrio sp.]|nr:HAD family hydrolase [Desulfovibrio sp.]MBI4959827.1 HAD family hydrolase [Desulfovibrio sp.]
MHNGKRLRAVVFDFDGTLARPALDFPLMKRRIAALAQEYLNTPEPGQTPALEWIEALAKNLDADQARSFRDRSHALIQDMEEEAASRTSLFEFVRPALRRLSSRGIAPAVITRNNRQAVATVFPDAKDYLSALLTREDVGAVKPDPTHLLAALQAVGVGPSEALMVGDHPSDVLTARRAGTFAGAVASGGTPMEELLRDGPDFFAPDVGELLRSLEKAGWV